MSRELPSDAIGHLAEQDPAILEQAADLSPTLYSWNVEHPSIYGDKEFVFSLFAAAYDNAVYSIMRQARGEARHADLPIGAAIGDPDTGQIWPGFARDKDLQDPTAHAERVAAEDLIEWRTNVLGMDKEDARFLGGLTVASTMENCPNCLDYLSDHKISRVTHGAFRGEVEHIGLIRSHAQKAKDIVQAGRADGRYQFEFFQIPSNAVQAACLELFVPFARDLVADEVRLDPLAIPGTRFSHFEREMRELREPRERLPALYHGSTETEALQNAFSNVLNSFYRLSPQD